MVITKENIVEAYKKIGLKVLSHKTIDYDYKTGKVEQCCPIAALYFAYHMEDLNVDYNKNGNRIMKWGDSIFGHDNKFAFTYGFDNRLLIHAGFAIITDEMQKLYDLGVELSKELTKELSV